MQLAYAVAAALVAGGVVMLVACVYRRKRRRKSAGGLNDWVSDPSYRRAVEAEWERSIASSP